MRTAGTLSLSFHYRCGTHNLRVSLVDRKHVVTIAARIRVLSCHVPPSEGPRRGTTAACPRSAGRGAAVPGQTAIEAAAMAVSRGGASQKKSEQTAQRDVLASRL
jgi:hypothetical protein